MKILRRWVRFRGELSPSLAPILSELALPGALLNISRDCGSSKRIHLNSFKEHFQPSARLAPTSGLGRRPVGWAKDWTP